MKRASLPLALALSLATAPIGAEEAPAPQASALRDLCEGSETKRHNKVKKFAEIKAMPAKDRRRLVEEGRKKAEAAARREAKGAMAEALAKCGQDAAGIERLLRMAGHLQEDWEALRRADTPEIRRLKADREAQAAWVHRRGFTRPGTDAPAAAFVFSDERFEPVPPAMAQYLASIGFDLEDAQILVLAMDLRETIARRMLDAKASPSK